MKRKRLFFDATPLVNTHVSGVGKVLLETLRALDKREYSTKYELYAFIPMNEAGKLDKYDFKYVKVKLLPYPHKLLSLFSRLRLSPPIDIFLGRGVYIFENYRNWNLLFSKSITYIHDIAFRVHPEFVEAANLRYLNGHIDKWLGRTDRVVTVSESSKREIEEQLGVDGVEVVVNAADDDMYPRIKQEIDAVRKKWSIPERYYVHLSNVEPRKNIVNIVKAFALHAKQTGSKDALVLIGGDGWKNEEIYVEIEKARATGVDIIKPKAFVPDEDLPALLSGAVALIQLSWHEGFGMSVLHSLACGTPVVAADIPSLHEAAKGNEKNVIYVDPADVEGASRAFAAVAELAHVSKPQNVTKWHESIKSFERIVDDL